MDKITEERLQLLHPKIKQDVIDSINELESINVNIRIVQGLRSYEEQDNLYATGRTIPGKIITNAKGGQSYHNFGVALDFCLLHKDGNISWDLNEDINHDNSKDWNQVVQVFGKRGFAWGGVWKFKDNPHLEKTFGLSFIQMDQMLKSNKIDENNYILI